MYDEPDSSVLLRPLTALALTGLLRSAPATATLAEPIEGGGMAQARRKVEEAGSLDLAALDLDATASTVYDQLLRSPDADAPDIAKATHASRATVEAALSQLVRAGLARTAQRPAGVEALRPESALAQQISLKQRDAADHVGRLSELREEIGDLERMWRRHHRGEVETREFEIVHGLDAANHRLESLLAAATTSLVGATKFNPATAGTDPSDIALSSDLASRGISSRAIGELRSLESPEHRERWVALAATGEESRFVGAVPVQFRLIDEVVAMLPLEPSDNTIGVVITRAPSLVIAVHAVFEDLWHRATPMPGKSTQAHIGTHPSLPALLATGVCDDAIARTLGVSARTVRRQVAVLMDEFRAQSRLQLGVALERSGMLRCAATRPPA